MTKKHDLLERLEFPSSEAELSEAAGEAAVELRRLRSSDEPGVTKGQAIVKAARAYILAWMEKREADRERAFSELYISVANAVEPGVTKTISGGQLGYLIEDYLCTLDDGQNEEYCVSARDHARREIEGFVEWLNKRGAVEPKEKISAGEESLRAAALGKKFVSDSGEMSKFRSDVSADRNISSSLWLNQFGGGRGCRNSGGTGSGFGHSRAGLTAQPHRSSRHGTSP